MTYVVACASAWRKERHEDQGNRPKSEKHFFVAHTDEYRYHLDETQQGYLQAQAASACGAKEYRMGRRVMALMGGDQGEWLGRVISTTYNVQYVQLRCMCAYEIPDDVRRQGGRHGRAGMRTATTSIGAAGGSLRRLAPGITPAHDNGSMIIGRVYEVPSSDGVHSRHRSALYHLEDRGPCRDDGWCGIETLRY
ncbi:hypothetical protein ACRALDRAFT_1072869 [Sodiomyces alcalophilus JCM 7366]|uniref:uncharacterized protein n=1 Tax=Sodiomyces alcalophilus JCM 7366 TaxID=591952 RepID=UPI0039B4EA5B